MQVQVYGPLRNLLPLRRMGVEPSPSYIGDMFAWSEMNAPAQQSTLAMGT